MVIFNARRYRSKKACWADAANRSSRRESRVGERDELEIERALFSCFRAPSYSLNCNFGGRVLTQPEVHDVDPAGAELVGRFRQPAVS